MKVFVTGASGMIGSAIVKELVAGGHAVTGLARSEQSAAIVAALGATPVRGTHTDLDVLAAAAAEADAVCHLAFNHEGMAKGEMIQACEEDRAALKAMLDPLVGTAKRFANASGTLGNAGPDETAEKVANSFAPRGESELLVKSYAARGVNAVSVRIAPVTHNSGDGKEHPFIADQIAAAKRTGVVAYIGDGEGAWQYAHVSDVAHLFVLAITTPAPAGSYLHAFDEEIKIKDMAAWIGARLGLPTKSITPDEAMPHFQGMIAIILQLDTHITKDLTQKWLAWEPKGPKAFEDLAKYSGFQ